MTDVLAAGNAGAAIPAASEKGCDVIMKGGITSGVVYPRAIAELSQKYHFVNLGGTSAGAIAAAVAAAAEYGRAEGGFARIAEIPNELGENLLKLFQPSPSVKPLFDILIAALGDKPKPGTPPKTGLSAVISRIEGLDRIATAICKGYPLWALGGVLPGFLLFVIAAFKGHAGWAAFGVLAAIVGLVGALVYRLAVAVLRDLPANDYGLCTGATQNEAAYGHKALTEWLANTIDECAGLKARDQPGGDPLTFGHLKTPPHGKPINLAMMTTNLSMRRPYKIPFHDRTLLYREADIRELMPKRVADYMIAHSDIVAADGKKDAGGEPTQLEDFRHLPCEDYFPVVLGARLSLSFPILFTAIPLYTRDFSLNTDAERLKPRRCHFSDGGLSNNFPIQFFDRLWPNGPTFAIGLDEFNPARNKEDERVWMPKLVDAHGNPITSGALLPVEAIDGLPDFLVSILYAAKDWQDNLQSTLVGYRERIVHVALKSDEGGLNLTMPKETIDALTAYGQEAGTELNTKFDLDDHRWRRFLVAMTRLEMTLFDLQDAHDHAPAGSESFGAFLKRYPPDAVVYRHDTAWLTEARQRVDILVQLAKDWRTKPMFQKNGIPKTQTDLRITPKP
jgi:predicted acylesterase/phospholipase RssA